MNVRARRRIVAATIAIAAVAYCAAPVNGADQRSTDRATARTTTQSARGSSNVSINPPNALWYVRGDTYRRVVRNWITNGTKWRAYDGKPIQIQYRPTDGGKWRLAGKARQRAGPDSKWARGTVRFELPEVGTFNLRIRARTGGEWRTKEPRRASRVTAGPVAYDPKPIRKVNLGENIALGWKRSYLAAGLSFAWEYPELNIRQGLAGDDDWYTYGIQPDSADTADRLVYSKAIIHGEDVYGTRVEAMNPRTGEARWVSLRRDGTRTPYTWDPAVSDTGKWVSYASTNRDIVAGTPQGNKVFLARMRNNTSESRYVGRGHRSGISGNGRYVVWTRRNKVLRWDRRSGETVTVAEVARDTPGTPLVSNNGRYVAYTQRREAKPRLREIVSVDLKQQRATTVSTGRRPVMTDDGRYIAFCGPGHSKYGFTDVARWDRSTGEVTIVSVGPDGTGTNNPTYDVDMSQSGRWIVTSFGNYREPPGPDVTLMDGVIYDLNAAR